MIKFLVAVLFLTCSFTQFLLAINNPANSPNTPLYIETESYEGVIFSGEEVSDFALWTGIENIDGYWTPTPEDIARMESQFPAFLEANADAFNRDILADLPEYIRQYLGYTVEGQRWIYINAACSQGDGLDWRSDIVFVSDGGDCFFQLVYNVDLGEFSQLMINGEA